MLWPWNWVIIKHFSAGQNDYFHMKRRENVMNIRRELVALRHSTSRFWTNLSCLLCRQARCHATMLSPGLLPSPVHECPGTIWVTVSWFGLGWSGLVFPFMPVTRTRDTSFSLQRNQWESWAVILLWPFWNAPTSHITHPEAAKFKQISPLISTGTVANSSCYLWLTCKLRFGKSW